MKKNEYGNLLNLYNIMLWYIVIILIIVILFLFLKKGYFEGLENNFDIYAITMKHKNRIDIIKRVHLYKPLH